MRKLSAEQIQNNWQELMDIIDKYISDDRKPQLLEMYNHFGERMAMAPASGREHFHNAMPGGYVEHVLHIIKFSLQVKEVWEKNGANINFTEEELVFSAMHHDLGKAGDLDNDYYIPNKSEWHRINQGKIYSHNPDLQYMKVPDRGLWLLQHFGVKVTDKEYIGIKLTDGLFDEANKSYLMSYNPDFALRSHLPHILHQADMMATYIEGDLWNNDEVEETPQQPKQDKEKVDNMKKAFDDLFSN